MFLVHYKVGAGHKIGFLAGEAIVDLEYGNRLWLEHGSQDRAEHLDVGEIPADIDTLLSLGVHRFDWLERVFQFIGANPDRLSKGAHDRQVFPADQAELLPPVMRPGKIICVGLNYPAAPGGEVDRAPEYPILFHKVASALTGHRMPVILPAASREVEYEGELAVVIGQRAKYVREEQAEEAIAGYTIANDVGARDVQRRTSQWTSGKMFDTFCPLGPALATRLEVPEPNRLNLETTLNGTPVQSACTGEMIFQAPFLVSYISSLTTLEPGDLILTGSPKRVGSRPDPRTLLQPGDRITVTIEKLGSLTNPVLREET